MIIEFFSEIGFKKYDLALLFFCPIGAVVGSFAQTILATINPDQMPTNEKHYRIASKELASMRWGWMILRHFLGAILGLVIALFFMGALQENVPTLAKIIALSILMGYAAPKIWVAQEKVIVNRVRELVNRELVLSRESTPVALPKLSANTVNPRNAPQTEPSLP